MGKSQFRGYIDTRYLKSTAIDSKGNPKKNLKVYDVYYYRPVGNGIYKKTSKKGFRRQSDAAAFLAEINALVITNQYTAESKLALGDFLDQYYSNHVIGTLRECTVDGYRTNINHLKKALGDIPLQQLTTQRVQELYNEKYRKYLSKEKDGLSPKSIQYLNSVLRRALGFAIKEGLITKNVAKDTVRPKVPKYNNQILTASELQKLLEAVRDTFFEMPIMLGGLCGMRRGEVLGLKYSDINWDEKTLTVQRALVSHSGGQYLGEVKTETSKRVIPIGDEILDALKRNRDRQQMLENINPENYTDNELVVSDDFGNPVISNSFSKRFQRLLEINNFKPCRFHDLRHSFATLMMNSNVPLKIASQLLGHSSVSVTADIYQNPQLNHKKEATDKVTTTVFNSLKEDTVLYSAS